MVMLSVGFGSRETKAYASAASLAEETIGAVKTVTMQVRCTFLGLEHFLQFGYTRMNTRFAEEANLIQGRLTQIMHGR